MPQRMTTKSVATEQDDVNREDDCANADSESTVEPERFPNIVAQDQNENEREIQKIAMHVLHDERKRALAPITFPRFADGARRRVSPERFVIRASIIITGQPKTARRPQNQQRRRKNTPIRPP